MSDFRMDKTKPIGKRNKSTIMGINVGGNKKPVRPSLTPAPVQPEDAGLPDNPNLLRPFEIVQPVVQEGMDLSPEEALGQVVTVVEKEEDYAEDSNAVSVNDDSDTEDDEGADSEVDESEADDSDAEGDSASDTEAGVDISDEEGEVEEDEDADVDEETEDESVDGDDDDAEISDGDESV
jgi:hypothetical protein